MKLHVKHDFIYYDIALKKGMHELRPEKTYFVLGETVMLPKNIITDNRYYFDIIETLKDEQKNEKVLDLFGVGN